MKLTSARLLEREERAALKEEQVQEQAGGEGSPRPNSEKDQIYIRDLHDPVPTEAEQVQTGLSTPQQHHCGDEGAFRSFRSSKAFARQGTKP